MTLRRWTAGLIVACALPMLVGASSCDTTNAPAGDATTTSSASTTTTAPTAAPTVAPTTAPPAPVGGGGGTSNDPYADAKAAGATAVCADGTWSFSQNRSGTCSHHGGVHWWTGNLGPAGPGDH